MEIVCHLSVCSVTLWQTMCYGLTDGAWHLSGMPDTDGFMTDGLGICQDILR